LFGFISAKFGFISAKFQGQTWAPPSQHLKLDAPFSLDGHKLTRIWLSKLFCTQFGLSQLDPVVVLNPETQTNDLKWLCLV
jgi:hypothetical protein